MFTWASKYLFSLAGVSLLSAALYGLISGGGAIGVISAGYKGGVGDHVGYTVLVALGIVTLFLGGPAGPGPCPPRGTLSCCSPR